MTALIVFAALLALAVIVQTLAFAGERHAAMRRVLREAHEQSLALNAALMEQMRVFTNSLEVAFTRDSYEDSLLDAITKDRRLLIEALVARNPYEARALGALEASAAARVRGGFIDEMRDRAGEPFLDDEGNPVPLVGLGPVGLST